MTAPVRTFTHDESGTPEARWSSAPGWSRVAKTPGLADLGVRRLVVVAAHPDDETLAAGGLIALAAAAGLEVCLVLLTDGEGSHPASPTTTSDELARLRVEESREALRLLAPHARLERLGLPDGSVAEHVDHVVTTIVDLVREDGPETLLVAPWRADGHTDHDAAGRAAAVAAWRTDARLWEYPVWLWHWGEPDDAPWGDLHVVPLPDEVRTAKAGAVACHRTQVARLSDEAGDERVLHDGMLAHFDRGHESFLSLGPLADDSLDRLHEDVDDPWSVRTSWYEERKRAVTLASLPHQRYSRALEVGGSIGRLAADLAGRCDELVVVDESEAAVRAAEAGLAGDAGVTVLRRTVPEQWPDGAFDLVVVSEVGYFLSPERLRQLVHRVDACLTADGVVVLCHWQHPIEGWPLDGARVAEIWQHESELPVLASHLEADFALHVLSRTAAHRAT
ncbi:hypothetical protein GCM10023258_36270 [Terrabacter aeriphilus]|uniref:LmbE family N-acetylglucosaminyl deacetylase n=1 Tax=Terrabacter aeriphilus TaxID=515662 RepID=A0ABP9JKF2_9MICO